MKNRNLMLAFVAVLMLTATPALAQSDPNDDQPRAKQGRADETRGRKQGRGAAADREEIRDRARSSAEQQQGEMSEEAKEAYLSGFYAGYAHGYYDGNEDSVLYIMGIADQRRKQMQEGRRRERREPELDRRRGALRRRMQQRHAASPPRGTEVDISGQVLGLKTVPIRGTDVEHLIARIRTDFNFPKIVDLGPATNLKERKIEEGDRISVQGFPVATKDFQVIAARRVKVGDEIIDIKYTQPKRKAGKRDADADARDRSRRQDRRKREQDE